MFYEIINVKIHQIASKLFSVLGYIKLFSIRASHHRSDCSVHLPVFSRELIVYIGKLRRCRTLANSAFSSQLSTGKKER